MIEPPLNLGELAGMLMRHQVAGPMPVHFRSQEAHAPAGRLRLVRSGGSAMTGRAPRIAKAIKAVAGAVAGAAVIVARAPALPRRVQGVPQPAM